MGRSQSSQTSGKKKRVPVSEDFANLYEEWLVRYSRWQKQVEPEASRRRQDGADDDPIRKLWIDSVVMRAGRAGVLHCAVHEERDQETRTGMEELLRHTRLEMDIDAASEVQLRALEDLLSHASLNDEEIPTSVEEEVNVDDFFNEYPECIRKDRGSPGDEDSESDDDSVLEIAPPQKKKSTFEEEKRCLESQQKRPLSDSSRTNVTVQTVGGRGGKPAPTNNPYASGRNSNPYAHTAGPGGNPLDVARQRQQQEQQSWNSGTVAMTHSAPYQQPQERIGLPAVDRSGFSTNHHSWEDHQNNQNPFQTAREYAAAGDDNHGSNRPPSRGRNAQQQQHPPVASSAGPPPQNPSYHQRQEDSPSQQQSTTLATNGIRSSLKRKFQPPKRGSEGGTRNRRGSASSSNGGGATASKSGSSSSDSNDEEELPEELKGLTKELVDKIQNEIMESGDPITFHDIAGLDDAKQIVQEVVCWPMKRPDLFTGLRRAPNGLLLYGPPGTGKTLIGKAIAHESGATFFSISSSSLTSKWIGEGEKLVRTLFAVAAYREPAVVFIDEIDSLLTQRKADENEASRRIKTEFLVQLDGTGTSGQGRVLVIGATNRPQELDEAARRRFVKRLYIPLPEEADRAVLINVLLESNKHRLTQDDVNKLAAETNGFSGADLKALCTDAAMGPIRQLGPRALEIAVDDIPPISYKHFRQALRGMNPSVSPADLQQYVEWDKTFGSKRSMERDGESDEDD